MRDPESRRAQQASDFRLMDGWKGDERDGEAGASEVRQAEEVHVDDSPCLWDRRRCSLLRMQALSSSIKTGDWGWSQKGLDKCHALGLVGGTDTFICRDF